MTKKIVLRRRHNMPHGDYDERGFIITSLVNLACIRIPDGVFFAGDFMDRDQIHDVFKRYETEASIITYRN